MGLGNGNESRVFIPGNDPDDKDFLESHYTKNHGWVLNKITNINSKGYVQKRD